MIKDLSQSLIKGLDERVRNPLLGAFTIAWCICNWRTIVVLLSGGPTPLKLELLDDVYPGLSFALILPLVLAGLYIGVMPWVTIKIDKYIVRITTLGKLQRLEAESSLNKQRAENAEELRDAESIAFDRSSALKNALRDLQQQVNQFSGENHNQENKIVRMQKEIDLLKSNPVDNADALIRKISDLTEKNDWLTNWQKETKDHHTTEVENLKALLSAKHDEIKQLMIQLRNKKNP